MSLPLACSSGVRLISSIPANIAQFVLKKLAADVPQKYLKAMFCIDDDSDDAAYEIQESLESLAEQELPAFLIAMMQMVCTQDLATDSPEEFRYLQELQNLADLHLAGIRNQVQVEMKAEAAQRAGKAPTKPSSKKAEPKVTQHEASAAIAQAMQAADAASSRAAFEPGQTVRIKVDLRGAEKALLPTRQRLAVIKQKMGDRAFLIELPADPHAQPTDMTERWVISADYTELQAVEAQEELA